MRIVVPYKSIDWFQDAWDKDDIFYKNGPCFLKKDDSDIIVNPGDLVILFNNKLTIKLSIDIFDEYVHKKMMGDF